MQVKLVKFVLLNLTEMSAHNCQELETVWWEGREGEREGGREEGREGA